jgi:hypothetical protein
MDVRVHNGLSSGCRDVHPDVVARWRPRAVQSASHDTQQLVDRADFLDCQVKKVRDVPTWKDQCMSSSHGIRVSDCQGASIGLQDPVWREVAERAWLFRTNAHSTPRWIVREPRTATQCHRSRALIERDLHASTAAIIWQPLVATLFPHPESVRQGYIFDSTNRRPPHWIILVFIALGVQKPIA